MFNFFKRNPLNQVQSLRDKAERIGLHYLEGLAVAGKISRQHIAGMARIMNENPDELAERIPDRRRPARYTKAMAGLRAAGLVGERQRFDRYDDNN
jgi:hypothetical protein